MMTEDNVLIHHGIKGQKWGVRRFQNEDGSRTSAGLARDRQTYAERTDGEFDDTPARKGLSEGQKNALKTVGKVALAAAAVGATAYLYSQHKDEIDGLIRQTKSADDKLTAYMVTRTMENAANRRLQNKQEKNRHKEEMARIRRGG